MRRKRIAILAAGALAVLALTAPVQALAAPELEVASSHYPAAVPAGSYASFELTVKNRGDAPSSDSIDVEFAAPAGLEVVKVSAPNLFGFFDSWTCSTPDSQTASCIGPFPGFGFEPAPGQEACEAFGITCRISVMVKADPGASPGTVTPQVSATGVPTPPASVSNWVDFDGTDPIDIGPPVNFAIKSFDGEALQENGDPATQAGSHPYSASTEFFSTTVLDPQNNLEYPTEDIKDVTVKLPPGIVGNPQAYPTCTMEQLLGFDGAIQCPPESQVGIANIWFDGETAGGPGNPAPSESAIYNMPTPEGIPALLAFNLAGVIVPVYATVRTGDDYGVDATSKNAPQTLPFEGVTFTIWGVPADPTHDSQRFCPGSSSSVPIFGCAGGNLKPFFTLPTSCVGPVETFLDLTSWQNGEDTGSFISHDNFGSPIGATGCPSVPFAPTIEARPTTNVGDAPSGLDVDLQVPQSDDPDGIATAHLKDTTVTLPEGLVVNPSGANGLGACSLSEFGYTSTDPDGTVHTTPDAATCPNAAKVATVEVDSPLVDHPLKGSAYIAKPFDNPFDSLLALYITIDDPQTGIVVKLAGKVAVDPNTGQLTATFENNPQLPFEHFLLHFKGGSHGTLRTPATCGTHATEATLTPWTVTGGATAVDLTDPWSIDQRCSSSTGEQPNSPFLDAGSVSPIAGTATPTVVNLKREDGSQEFSRVNLTLPPGLTGRLAGIAACPDSALAAAASRTGREEEASPSCPAGSRIGRVDVAAGAGPAPYNATGTAYLTGPYKGGPLGMAIVTPATAGPFDLGTVVVRVALHVDPSTGQITAISDEIPRILKGIPLDVRSTRVLLDRQNFTRNGTSCDPLAFSGQLVSTLNQAASLSERFQLGECTSLPFKPKLGIRLFGGTKRGAHPALRGTVTLPEGGANVAKASVALPHSEFLDQGHIGTVCTRVQFAEGDGNGSACPAASVYGHAVATSPLVDYPLEGPAILRSSSHQLPDLVIALHGPPSQPVAVDVVGRIDSIKGGIRTTFEGVPDLPVSTFVLNMEGGKKGLLQNSTNICKGVHKATAEFDGQNGKVADLSPVLKNSKCGKTKRKHARRRARSNRAAQRAAR